MQSSTNSSASTLPSPSDLSYELEINETISHEEKVALPEKREEIISMPAQSSPENKQDNEIVHPELQDTLEAHVEYVYETIYSKPYLIPIKYSREFRETPRMIHGIQHVTRVAIDIPVFANLYRRYGDAEALALTNDDIKLIQIAALFHDAARKDEGHDYWDNDSAWLLYCYLTEKLGVDLKKAKLLAEAIANKDAQMDNYVELVVTHNNRPRWVANPEINRKNIYQKLLQNADSLDIIRAMDFDGTRLDFYKEIAKNNPDAFKEYAKLIKEKTSLIEKQGDSKGRMNLEIKEKYNHRQAYQAIIADINKNKTRYKIYHTFHADNTVLTGDTLSQELIPVYSDSLLESKSITVESLTAAKHKGRLFVRGISAPHDISSVSTKDESAATISVRKMTGENGDTHRSVTLLDSLYTGQGFLIQYPEIDKIEHIYHTDANTGRGEKNHIEPSRLSREEKITQLDELHRKAQLGGTAKKLPDGTVMTHHEIIYTVNEVHAIFFSQDPNHYNRAVYGNPYACNRFTHYIQALRLQQTYFRDTEKLLPIFECSGIHDFIKPAPQYTDKQLVTMWVKIVSDLMRYKLKVNGQITETMESLKIEAIDGYTLTHTHIIRKQLPVDKLFTPELTDRISRALESAKTQCIADHNADIIERIKNGTLSVFSNEAFKTLQLSPSLIADVKTEIVIASNSAFNKNNEERIACLECIDKDYYPILNYDLYFQSEISKIFFYALATNNLKLTAIIRLSAEYLIQEKMDWIREKLEKKSADCSLLPGYFRDLIDYAARFYFYKDIKDNINSIIVEICDHLLSNNALFEFNLVITTLRRSGLLINETSDHCLNVLNKFKINSPENMNIINEAIELEKEIKSPVTVPLIPFANDILSELSSIPNCEVNKMRSFNSKKRTFLTSSNVSTQSTSQSPESKESNQDSTDCQQYESTTVVKSPSSTKKRMQLSHDESMQDKSPRKLKSPRLSSQFSNLCETKDDNTQIRIQYNTSPSSHTRLSFFNNNETSFADNPTEVQSSSNNETSQVSRTRNRFFKRIRIARLKKPALPKKIKQAANKLSNILHRRS